MTDEQIIERLGFGSASEAVQREAVERVRAVIDLRVGVIVGESLDGEQREHFERLRDAGDQQAIWDFLHQDVTGVDMSEVYEGALQEYLAEVTAR